MENSIKNNQKPVDTPDKAVKMSKLESLIIFRCNCRCIMCSTGLQIDRSIGSTDYQAIRPFNEVLKDIDKAKDLNVGGIAFSGGEATLRTDLPDLARYARSVGLKDVEVQSNGKMYSYKEYCQKLINAGVNHFVVSFHSHIESVHDYIMGTPGTYKQALQGIKNLNELKQIVKINIVITKHNYKTLEEHIRFLLDYDIAEFRLTMTMIEGNVKKNPLEVVEKMSVIAPHLCRALDIAKGKVDCFVYNMVPCLMPDHVRYINDMGRLDTLLVGPDFESSLDESRKNRKVKSDKCTQCKYDNVCYGVWKEYADVFGLDELTPIS
jgi:MoaA/NifB/PqqE/SkfB family radical SAM enzyme